MRQHQRTNRPRRKRQQRLSIPFGVFESGKTAGRLRSDQPFLRFGVTVLRERLPVEVSGIGLLGEWSGSRYPGAFEAVQSNILTGHLQRVPSVSAGHARLDCVPP